MTTAVDTSVLVDFLKRDSKFGLASREVLQTCAREGSLLACDVVWAEVAGCFASASICQEALRELEVEFSPLRAETAFEAGRAWNIYRQEGGTRTRVVADFLIGAHARYQADRLLTRDRGFYRTYFKGLRILEPSLH